MGASGAYGASMTTWPEAPHGSSEIVVRSGVLDRSLRVWTWLDSHSASTPTPGPHVAINGLPQREGSPETLVVHLDQVPALVAALTASATHLARVWQSDGEANHAGEAARTPPVPPA